jgi:hypothetical protein
MEKKDAHTKAQRHNERREDAEGKTNKDFPWTLELAFCFSKYLCTMAKLNPKY